MSDLDDKKAAMLKASKLAAAKADVLVEPQLEAITKEVDELAGIFTDLKLTDQATYDALVKIVDEATRRNEAIGSVIERIKALGQGGVKLATSIGSITSGGALAALSSALKK